MGARLPAATESGRGHRIWELSGNLLQGYGCQASGTYHVYETLHH